MSSGRNSTEQENEKAINAAYLYIVLIRKSFFRSLSHKCQLYEPSDGLLPVLLHIDMTHRKKSALIFYDLKNRNFPERKNG